MHLTAPNQCAMYSPCSLTYGGDALLFGRACSYVTIKADDSVALLLYVCSMAGRCSQCCLNVTSVSFATSIRVLPMDISCSPCTNSDFQVMWAATILTSQPMAFNRSIQLAQASH